MDKKTISRWWRKLAEPEKAGQVACFALVGLLVALSLWDWLTAQPDGRESASTMVRNLVITASVLLGLRLTWQRLSVADRQAATAQSSLQNDRYQKGSEMLGSKVLSVRLGGIYALRNLAEDYPEQYHVEVMSSFCAFVQDPPADKTIAHSEGGSDPHNGDNRHLARFLRLRPDVQNIVEIICERSEAGIALEKKKRGFQLDLQYAHLQRAWFEDADLSNAALDHADFTRANLRGADLGNATLCGTKLKGVRNLTQAQLDQAGGYPDGPPEFEGVCDAQTGKPLVWNPRPIEGD